MPDAQVIEFPTLTRETAKPLVCVNCGSQWFYASVVMLTDGRVTGHARGVHCRECGKRHEV